MSHDRVPSPPTPVEAFAIIAMEQVLHDQLQPTQTSATEWGDVVWSAPQTILIEAKSYYYARLVADWLSDEPNAFAGDEPVATDSSARDLTLHLLRTAEEHNGWSSITGGLHYGFNPAPSFGSNWIADGQHRLGDRKRAVLLRLLAERLGQALCGLSRAIEAANAEQISRSLRNARALADFLLELTVSVLIGFARYFGHFAAPPPTGTSPCGVLRLAVPVIPRAPGVRSFPGPTNFALVA
ncbi:hypothetical protein ACFXI8_00555 [Streptomyces niveus]|uniref:hypothetical protein n=1 Tax=Streptomyces niveus TaxID=193462 RepID=UPI0036B01A3C